MKDHQSTEKIVNIRELFFFILKKWRLLIFFLIIGLIFGCGYSYVKMKQSDPAYQQQKANALKEEKLNMKQIKQYADYQSLYQEQLEYEEGSQLMQMDANNVWTGQLRYFVTADKNTIDIIDARYSSLIRQSSNVARLIQASGLNINEANRLAIRELVTIAFTKTASDAEIKVEENSDLRSGIVAINVLSASEDVCEKLLDTAKEICEKMSDELEAEFPDSFSAEELNRLLQFGFNSTVRDTQQTAVEARKAYITQITALEDKLSSDEKLYYRYRIANDENAASAKASFSKKWPLIIAVLFFVLAVFLLIVRYLFDNRVKSMDEFVLGSKIPAIALMPSEKKRSFFLDRFLDKLYRKGTAPLNDAEYLSAALSAMDFDKALLAADVSDEAQIKLYELLAKKDTRLVVAGDPATDADARKKLAECDGAVLSARLYDTRSASLRRTADVVTGAGKQVYGTVFFES
ncbi:MAG: hypothetical protein IKR59_04795 [Lachnospiraceae bacterium]|nr:hypothetical protein [Lachnospiraceae bacterium]